MTSRLLFFVVLHLTFVTPLIFAQSVDIRVVDVGAGLGTITRFPDGKVMVYDAGRYNRMMDTLYALVPNDTIDLLVLSHNDADHIGSVVEIEKNFFVKKIYYSKYRGDQCYEGSRKTYCKAMAAIGEMKKKGTKVVAVTNTIPAAGTVLLESGDAQVQYLCGFDKPYDIWKFKSSDVPSKPRNAISLVIRLDYMGKSIIYGGDAVGKLSNSEDCVYTERYLLDKVDPDLLNADIIISPHHGADNGDCREFIKAVSPQYVIFSAGSEHGHPRTTTVRRYLDSGVKAENMFRTDKGDHELRYGTKEWTQGRVENCVDQHGDDDVSIILTKTGDVEIKYVDEKLSNCK